jgi:small-conductance mechanosensitive channel
MKIIIILITGSAVFVLLTISRIFLNRISLTYPNWKKARKIFPLVGSIVWTAFAFWGIGLLFRDRTYYPYLVMGMVLIVLGLVTWYFFRDVFAGALFKMQNELDQGDYIKIGDISGQVKAAHLTHLEITSDNGQTIKIPHTRLNQELISRTTTPEGMEEFNISLLVDKRFSKQETENKIRYELANSPWCNFKAPPVIRLKKEDDGTYAYELQVYTMNHHHLRIVEKQLKDRLENCIM